MTWTTDLSSLTVTHESGLKVKFKYRDGGWDGEAVPPYPKDLKPDAASLARMMNEAGDTFITALRSSAAKYRCFRCGHFWDSKQPAAPTPRICPSCKSPYWDKPRSK